MQELDRKDELHKRFWAALLILADDELGAAQLREEQDKAYLRWGGGGVKLRGEQDKACLRWRGGGGTAEGGAGQGLSEASGWAWSWGVRSSNIANEGGRWETRCLASHGTAPA